MIWNIIWPVNIDPIVLSVAPKIQHTKKLSLKPLISFDLYSL